MITTEQMACHTWALAANPQTGEAINRAYSALSNEIGALYDYGGNLRGKTLTDVRQETMTKIAKLCEPRTWHPDHKVFVCGGFREGQVCPEHLWLEDHTSVMTLDTFPGLSVVLVNRVGREHQPFRPGCEESEFAANEIARVQVNGYTEHQILSSRLAEHRA